MFGEWTRTASLSSGRRTTAPEEPSDMATGAETPLFADPHYDVGSAIKDPWTRRVIGATYVAEKEEFHYFDPSREALQKGLEAAFPGLSVHAISFDLARDKVIAAVEGPRRPLAYYLVDRTTHQATLFGKAYPNLKDSDLGEMKQYAYTARDGLAIPAYITLPPGKTPKNLPAIVMPHGGPDWRDSIGFDWWAQFLANRGYVVFQPNYRGSSGYGHAFTEAGLHQWGRTTSPTA
jgi:dipeptidyl aminopeptidase/acylaminoacyl peptidase